MAVNSSLFSVCLDCDKTLDKPPHPAIHTIIVEKSEVSPSDQRLVTVAGPRPTSSKACKEVKSFLPERMLISDLSFGKYQPLDIVICLMS